MNDTQRVKSRIMACGADLCGIAAVDAFEGAPKGFHPRDLYHRCGSVVVFARRLPRGSLHARSCIPYTYVNALMTQEVDLITLRIARELEDMGIESVPIPSDDPSEYWEPERSYARGLVSLRHAGQLAGLGSLGRNTLLINSQYGNMIQLGALLTDVELDGDSAGAAVSCPPECDACMRACPQRALDGLSVDQHRCRPLSNWRSERGFVLKKCNLCRKVCPLRFGIQQHTASESD